MTQRVGLRRAMSASDNGYVEVDISEDVAHLSVKELKARLREAGIDYGGCVEKSDLVALLAAQRAGGARQACGTAAETAPFLKESLGAGAALSAQHALSVMELTVPQLKAYLTEQGISFHGVTDKEELQRLALDGKGSARSIDGQQSVADHLLEC